MKKAIALALSLVMLLSMIPMAGAASFRDSANVSLLTAEAVDIMSDLKIIAGFPDGTFKPAETLTRAQAAKILSCILLGPEKAETLAAGGTTFADVPASHWANKYIEFCASKGVVAGVGGGKFNPDGKLSGTAFGKMLLVAIGADASALTGAGWDTNTMTQLKEKRLDHGVTVKNDEIDRQSACRLAMNALFINEQEDPEQPLAYRIFGVVREKIGNNNDYYVRPYYRYTSNDSDAYWTGTDKTVTGSPMRIHEDGPITGDAFVKLLGEKEIAKSRLTAIRNNVKWSPNNANIKDVWQEGNNELYYRAENGMRLEFYYDVWRDTYTVLHVPTWADKITEVTEPVLDADGYVTTPGSVTFEKYGTIPANCFKAADVGSYGLFNGNSAKSWTKLSKAREAVETTYVTGKLEANEKDVSVTVDGKTYRYPYTAMVARSADQYLAEGGAIGDTVKLAVDSFGYCYAIWK
ncbi:MAG: S-layer homology domain-containing protein [Oscillospiraceae bacterium]|nr:S-layer homology domain-containing protein [Oscillospiraceae bacterium]